MLQRPAIKPLRHNTINGVMEGGNVTPFSGSITPFTSDGVGYLHSLNESYITKIIFNNGHLSILRQLGEYRGKQELYYRKSAAALDSLHQHAIIESVESSNRLEQITAPRQRIVGIVREKTMPKDRSEQEIAGYVEALRLIHATHTQMQIDTKVILQLHKLLYRYHPEEGGIFKKTDNLIVEKDTDGNVARVRFKPVQASQTPAAVHKLCEHYNELALTAEPLLVLPLTILDFLCIHPFRDGNGRVARLLTLLMLHRSSYEVGRYISLERIFEQQKEGYYRSLEHSSQGWHSSAHDPFPWLNYFWGVMLAAYKEFAAKLETIKHTSTATKATQVRLAVLAKSAPFTISEIAAECPEVSNDTIRNVIRQLRDEGTIAATGTGRNAKWCKTTLV